MGRTGMALARRSLRHEADEDVPSLRGVRKVEIGVYEARPGSHRTPAGRPHLDIRRLMVLVEEPDELVIVRLTGDLGPFLADALTLAFDEAEHPEQAGPALEHYQEHKEQAGHARGERVAGSLR